MTQGQKEWRETCRRQGLRPAGWGAALIKQVSGGDGDCLYVREPNGANSWKGNPIWAPAWAVALATVSRTTAKQRRAWIEWVRDRPELQVEIEALLELGAAVDQVVEVARRGLPRRRARSRRA